MASSCQAIHSPSRPPRLSFRTTAEVCAKPGRRAGVSTGSPVGRNAEARSPGRLAPRVTGSACLRVSLQAPEVQQDARLVADDPRVVPRRHVEGLARSELTLGPVVHTKRHTPFEHVADVLNLARVGPGDRLDVLRPPPPGLERAAANGVSV